MIKFSRNIITKILLIACAGIFFIGFFLYKNAPSRTKSNNSYLEKELKARVNAIWVGGKRELNLQNEDKICPSIEGRYSDYPLSFFECNPHFFKCWIQNNLSASSKIKISGRNFYPDPKQYTIYPNGEIEFFIRNEERNFHFYLKRNCHQVEIPNKVFSAGRDPDSKNLWDTYLQKLEVDKYYVSVYESKLLAGDDFIVTPNDIMPFLSFDKEQMENICFFKGGALLANRVLEAISYFPTQLRKGFMFKSLVPWDKSLSLQQSKENDYCGYFFSSNCKKKNYSAYSHYSPSWLSVFHLLGSEVEYIDDQLTGEGNLKLSSHYFPAHHLVQQNGFRKKWNEKNGAELVVDHSELQEKINNKEIKGFAFRCMY